MYGTFEDVVDDREDYATFVFRANPGTSNRNINLIMGVGDGLGQVARRSVVLKGNDGPESLIAAFADPFENAPFFFDMGVGIAPISDVTFSDVPTYHWARTAIYTLVAHGAIGGMGDGTFGPNEFSTVEHFLALTLRISGVNVPGVGFTEHWADAYVQFAIANNLLPEGVARTDFITREYAFYLMYMIFGRGDTVGWNRVRHGNPQTNANMNFSDQGQITGRYQNAMQRLFHLGIVAGHDDGAVRPLDNMDRAQMAELIFRAITPSGSNVQNMIESYYPNIMGVTGLFINEPGGLRTTNRFGAHVFRFTAPTDDYYSFWVSGGLIPTLFAINFDYRGRPYYTFTRSISAPMENQPGYIRVRQFLHGGQNIIVAVTGLAEQNFTAEVGRSATGIELNYGNFAFDYAGETKELIATILPANATDRAVRWESSNTDVVRLVNIDGYTATMYAVADGRANITARNAYGYYVSVDVTVGVLPIYVRPVRIPVHGIAGTHRAFGSRATAHAGIDFVPTHNLNQGIEEPFPNVYAVADGVIVRYAHFFAGTYALEVRKDDGRIVRYGEIHAVDGIVVGTRVSQGQVIARMGRMIGISEIMLHLEYFKGTATGSLSDPGNLTYDYVASRNFGRRRDLLDPTFFFYLPISPSIGAYIQGHLDDYISNVFTDGDDWKSEIALRPHSAPNQTNIDGFELGLNPEELVWTLDERGIAILQAYQDWETIYSIVENPVRDGRRYNVGSDFSFSFATENIIFDYTCEGLMESITVISALYRTSENIGISDSRRRVIEAHGADYLISPFDSNVIEYFDGENYLFFVFSFDDVVLHWGIRQISIFEFHAQRFS